MLAYVMTDVVGSTRLWEADEAKMARAVEALDRACEEIFEQAGGRLLKSRGEGDSHFGIFGNAEEAITAATNLVLATKTDSRLDGLVLRTGIHLGSAETWAGDYYGPTVNRCARIRQVAQPGQILVSEAVYAVAHLGGEHKFKDLGIHRLRDLMQPERLYQVLNPGLAADCPAPETLSSLAHNLPGYLNSFVGRERDLSDLSEVIGHSRLVTVTGPGGAGKTRLTQQVAADLIEQFKDGVWFIDLAQTDRPESVLPILCKEFDVTAEPAEQHLLTTLRHRNMLLILDNCEHLFDECRRITQALLQRCPELNILATSRRLLDLRGEYVYRLGGLALPPANPSQDPLQYDGIRLFVERAKQRGTELTLDSATWPGIVDLCRKLDGLPLALEMAASLTDVLSISEISRSLSECLQTSTGFGTDDPRQQTIASTIEWSRRLLTEPARLLLQKVAYFPGTWTLDGAAAVCFPEASKLYVRGLVKELLNHSLVFTLRTSTDDLRFGLLQTTREVVAQDAGEQSDLAKPFVEFCRKLAASARERMEVREEAKLRDLLNLDWETLIKALEISFATEVETCATIALDLRGFWMSGTRLPEARSWYQKLSARDDIGREKRASILIALSSIYILLGNNDLALNVLVAAEEMVRPIGGVQLARVIGNLAVHRDRMGRYQEAKEGFEECYELFKEAGAKREEALSLLNIGVAKLRLQEPFPDCADYYRRALGCAKANGLTSMQAKAYSCLAHLELRQGNLLQALATNKDALALWLEDLVIPDCVLAMLDLAEIFVEQGRFDAAATSIHIADRLEELSQSPFPSLHLTRLETSRQATKQQLSPIDWRSGQRLTKAKGALELVSLAAQLLEVSAS